MATEELVGEVGDAADGVDDGEAAAEQPSAGERSAVHRAHQRPARGRRVALRLDEGEYGEVCRAAAAAGLTPTGFAAEAALAAARGTQARDAAPLREALGELIAARTQVRRFGTNVNQAVAALNADPGAGAPEWLGSAVRLAARAVQRLDESAAMVARRLR
jgi:hypothetical protein